MLAYTYIWDGIHAEHGAYDQASDSSRDEHAGFQASHPGQILLRDRAAPHGRTSPFSASTDVLLRRRMLFNTQVDIGESIERHSRD
jgi:hypothetical protein